MVAIDPTVVSRRLSTSGRRPGVHPQPATTSVFVSCIFLVVIMSCIFPYFLAWQLRPRYYCKRRPYLNTREVAGKNSYLVCFSAYCSPLTMGGVVFSSRCIFDESVKATYTLAHNEAITAL